jgi:hypothetical protein
MANDPNQNNEWPPPASSGGGSTDNTSSTSASGNTGGGSGASGSNESSSGGAGTTATQEAKAGEINHSLPDKVTHVRCGKDLENPEAEEGDLYGSVYNHIHAVLQGECLIRLAEESGWYYETLWNLPENQELKEVRKNPNVLFPRDQVWIPKPREKEESCAAESKHTFKVKNRPSVLRLRVAVLDEPLASKPYTIEIEDEIFEGTTDANGQIEHVVGPRARAAHLVVGEEPELYEYDIQIGDMDPVDTVPGVKERLSNLGYAAGAPVQYGETNYFTTQAMRKAVYRFQMDHGVQPTGIVCERTIEELLKRGI